MMLCKKRANSDSDEVPKDKLACSNIKGWLVLVQECECMLVLESGGMLRMSSCSFW